MMNWISFFKIPAVVVFLVTLAGYAVTTNHVAAQDNQSGGGETGVLVDSLLRDIRDTLIRIRTAGGGNLRLNNAEVNLSAVFTTSASGKLDLWVISVGGGISGGTTQTLKLTLRPPEAGDDLPVSGTADALAAAILEAYEAVRSAELSDPPLRLGELEAAIRFVVEADGSAGVKFKILPVTAEMSGEISSSNIHEIVLVFCPGDCQAE